VHAPECAEYRAASAQESRRTAQLLPLMWRSGCDRERKERSAAFAAKSARSVICNSRMRLNHSAQQNLQRNETCKLAIDRDILVQLMCEVLLKLKETNGMDDQGARQNISVPLTSGGRNGHLIYGVVGRFHHNGHLHDSCVARHEADRRRKTHSMRSMFAVCKCMRPPSEGSTSCTFSLYEQQRRRSLEHPVRRGDSETSHTESLLRKQTQA
jgi:hypothetical protein